MYIVSANIALIINKYNIIARRE